MLDDLENAGEITAAAEHLLRAAAVEDELPTPVDRLVEAAGLRAGSDELFSDDVIDEAPGYLRDAVRRLRGKVRAVLDRREREVFLNPDLTVEAQRRFKTLHEVGHQILPSQQHLAYADDDFTLSWRTKIAHERDANQVGAELLFQRELFSQRAASDKVGMATVIDLAQDFGASYHAALRRYVETHRGAVAGVILDLKPCRKDSPSYRRREAFCSASWPEAFERPQAWPTILEPSVFTFLSEARKAALWGTTVKSQLRWINREHSPVDLSVEIFSNTYKLLVMIWVPRREVLKRKRRLVTAA